MPIVEPEVLMDGDHDIDRCFERHRARAERGVRASCSTAHVALEGIVLKPNMVDRRQEVRQAGLASQQVAEKTVTRAQALRAGARCRASPSCPAASRDEEATAHLDAMNKIGDLPWPLTFSYGRALQARAAEDLDRQGGKCRRRAARLRPSRRDERARRARPVAGGHGEKGRVGGAAFFLYTPNATRRQSQRVFLTVFDPAGPSLWMTLVSQSADPVVRLSITRFSGTTR